MTGGSAGNGGGPSDAFAHAQMILALLLGILLFAVPLYLWRRPRGAQALIRTDAALPDAAHADAAPPPPEPPPPPAVRLADARVLECHDRGMKRTPPEQCDHLTAFEKAMGDAILASHECVPADAGAGSIEYVADVSFARKRAPVTLSLPKDGRSYTSPKLMKDCASGVKARLAAFPVAPLVHQHARYKVAIVASYPGAVTAP